MAILTATDARKEFFQLAKDCCQSFEPVNIRTRSGDVVLVNSRYWSAQKELLEMVEMTELRNSLLQGVSVPASQCMERPDIHSEPEGRLIFTPNAGTDVDRIVNESELRKLKKALTDLKMGLSDPELLPCPLLDGVLHMKRLAPRKFVFLQHLRDLKVIKVIRVVL